MSRPPDPTNPLTSLRFDNRFTRLLPGDPLAENSRRQVFNACYSRVTPVRPVAPQLVAYSPETAALIDLDAAACASPLFTRVFSGDLVLPGMDPHAACYGGHQFGNWAGQLGDGRAINLGEAVNRRGEHWTLQLKGAGPTPYSRRADGLAVMRSSLREFLCSEAMHHLGVPTTRALSLILTGEQVERDMFYDGRPEEEPGAVVCRVAPSFLRFGNYELFAARGELDVLRRLADFTIRTLFPQLGEPSPAVYGQWFAEVCRTTAELMVHWLRVGFVHGVMNTDNLSILGLTIDYGPYGWIDDYDPDWTPNTTDAQGRRYRFGWQPRVAGWNLSRFAQALSPLFDGVEALQEGLQRFADAYARADRDNIARKLGLSDCRDEDMERMDTLQQLLAQGEIDMTLFFRALIDADPMDASLSAFDDAFYDPAKREAVAPALRDWLAAYARRRDEDALDAAARRERMRLANPRYVLRNYLAQQAIDAAEAGDLSGVHELLEVMRRPYDDQPGRARFAQRRPDWARQRAGCSMLSCSS